MVRLNRRAQGVSATVVARLEFFNPGFSVKHRIALSMAEAAKRDGLIGPGTIILEPTSGNAGIGLAMVCASKGYRYSLVMPATMNRERWILLRAFGADLVLTPGQEGTKGAVDKAHGMAATDRRYLVLDQFLNPAKPSGHREITTMAGYRRPGGCGCGRRRGGRHRSLVWVMGSRRTNPRWRYLAWSPRVYPYSQEGSQAPTGYTG
jgi:cysteine synthase A